MCYVGTNAVIPERKFDEANPDFHIEKADKSEFSEYTFTKENVYYVGTREGCGCGFGTEPIPTEISNGIDSY